MGLKVIIEMKKLTTILLGLLFLFCCAGTCFSMKHKRVLIINSYDPTYTWTHDMVDTLCNNLTDYILYIEYLDTKRFSRNSIFKIFLPYLNEKYKNLKLDLIIVTDNNALDFLVNNREKLVFKHVPVVFCGINEFKESMLKGYNDITGVVEDINVDKAIQFILQLQPEIKNIYVILDNTYTDQIYLEDVKNVKKKYAPRVKIDIINGKYLNLAEFKEVLKTIQNNSAILLFPLLKLKDGTLFSYREGVEFIYNNTRKPIYELVSMASWSPGVVAGLTSSSRLQGEYAAYFARQILDVHVNPAALPILRECPTKRIVNYIALKHFHIPIERVPSGVEIVNRPSPIIHLIRSQKRKIYVLELLSGFLFLFFVLFLINYIKRRRLQKEIEDKNIQFQALINGSNDIICMKDGKGRWLIANEADIKLFNLKDIDYRGKTDQELAKLVPEYKEELLFCMKTDEDAWNSGKPTRSLETILQPDGKKLIFDIIKTPIFDSAGRRKYLIVIGRDITEYKELEEQLIHSQKMELLGKIAGGIAHDFNNILSSLLMNAEILKIKLIDSPQLKKYIDNIISGLDSASELVKKIKIMSRKEKLQLRPIDFTDVIQRTLSLVCPSIPMHITLDIDMDESTEYMVMGDANQLMQVLMNLIVNAKDAILEARREHGKIEVKVGEEDGHLIVRVRDNGVGIREEDKRHIFDPFFTTKEHAAERGTGLGLSISRSIIKKHNGEIWFNSTEGVGTEFVVSLPLLKERGERDQGNERTRIKEEMRGKRILLVDDEEDIINILKEMLLLLGLEVVVARNGKEALKILSSPEGKKIDMVFIDWMMPVMDGRETVRAMREKGMDIPVVIVSGYLDREILDFKSQGLVNEVISKPFKLEKLIRKLNNMVCWFQKGKDREVRG